MRRSHSSQEIKVIDECSSRQARQGRKNHRVLKFERSPEKSRKDLSSQRPESENKPAECEAKGRGRIFSADDKCLTQFFQLGSDVGLESKNQNKPE
jgi:hypothetical protein